MKSAGAVSDVCCSVSGGSFAGFPGSAFGVAFTFLGCGGCLVVHGMSFPLRSSQKGETLCASPQFIGLRVSATGC